MDTTEVTTGYVYLVTNLVSGKKYVGCTRVTIKHRWSQHLSAAKRGSAVMAKKVAERDALLSPDELARKVHKREQARRYRANKKAENVP